jgi:hypothetical protein
MSVADLLPLLQLPCPARAQRATLTPNVLGDVMQADATASISPAPLKPTCHLIFKTGPCADSWRNYEQAIQQWNQQYIQRQQQTAASEAAAPLQQQITTLQQQMQTAATAARQAKADAHTLGLEQGVSIGVGASLVLFLLIISVKKLMSGFTVTKKEQARAASA